MVPLCVSDLCSASIHNQVCINSAGANISEHLESSQQYWSKAVSQMSVLYMILANVSFVH